MIVKTNATNHKNVDFPKLMYYPHNGMIAYMIKCLGPALPGSKLNTYKGILVHKGTSCCELLTEREFGDNAGTIWEDYHGEVTLTLKNS